MLRKKLIKHNIMIRIRPKFNISKHAEFALYNDAILFREG